MSDKASDRKPATEREPGLDHRPPTRRETDAPADSDWDPIPHSVRRHYRRVHMLGGGGEADVYLVEDLRRGGQAILKLYKIDCDLDEENLRRIKDEISDEHVVRLIEWGKVSETDRWYEVQEYIETGTLSGLVGNHGTGSPRRLGGPVLQDAIAELHRAVVAFHAAGLSHHDLNPSNVLVRATRPELDLVLADFGLSIAANRTVFLSKRQGTIAYDAPESLARQGGPKRDYWALGMTIAEIAGGRHPFSDPADTSQLWPDHTIDDHLHNRRPIDLSAVEDGRVRRLCEGLTRYDPKHRWGPEQVTAWLAGEDPKVESERPTIATVGAPGTVKVGKLVAIDEVSLAAALADDWREALRLLGGTDASRRAFLDRVSKAFGGKGLLGVEDRWAADSPGDDRAVADVIVALDPALENPVFRQFPVAADQLSELVGRAAGGGDDAQAASAAIDALYNQKALLSFARLPAHRNLERIDRDWRGAVGAFERACEVAGEHGITPIGGATARAALLRAAADESYRTALVRERDSAVSRAKEALAFDWFQSLARAEAEDPGAVLAARQLAEGAATRIREDRARTALEARQRVSETAVALRRWLRWPIAANLVAAAGFGLAAVQRDALLEHLWIATAEGSDMAGWIDTLLHWAPRWWVWAVAAAIGLAARMALRGTPPPAAVQGGAAAAVMSTVAVPALLPFGVREAFATRRQRTSAGPSNLRRWAVAGGTLVVLVLLGLAADQQFDAFDRLFSAWPVGVQEWYLANWPEWLHPAELNRHFAALLVAGLFLVAAGVGGSWVSYTQPNSGAVRGAQRVGAAGGVAAAGVALPVVLTGAAAALVVAAGIGLSLLVLWLVFTMLDDSC